MYFCVKKMDDLLNLSFVINQFLLPTHKEFWITKELIAIITVQNTSPKTRLQTDAPCFIPASSLKDAILKTLNENEKEGPKMNKNKLCTNYQPSLYIAKDILSNIYLLIYHDKHDYVHYKFASHDLAAVITQLMYDDLQDVCSVVKENKQLLIMCNDDKIYNQIDAHCLSIGVIPHDFEFKPPVVFTKLNRKKQIISS